MRKKTALLLGVLSLCLLLSGCWDYLGLDQIDIVTGVAVDKDERSGFYQLSFEIVDPTTSNKDGGVEPALVEAQGVTLFDAIYNAKMRLTNQLYFGSMQVLIISHQLAQDEGIQPIIDVFLRDGEQRETLNVLISEEESARDILSQKGIDNAIVSYMIKQIVDEDQKITSSTKNAQLYMVYRDIKGEGRSLVLPVIRRIDNNEDETV